MDDLSWIAAAFTIGIFIGSLLEGSLRSKK